MRHLTGRWWRLADLTGGGRVWCVELGRVAGRPSGKILELRGKSPPDSIVSESWPEEETELPTGMVCTEIPPVGSLDQINCRISVEAAEVWSHQYLRLRGTWRSSDHQPLSASAWSWPLCSELAWRDPRRDQLGSLSSQSGWRACLACLAGVSVSEAPLWIQMVFSPLVWVAAWAGSEVWNKKRITEISLPLNSHCTTYLRISILSMLVGLRSGIGARRTFFTDSLGDFL